MIFLKHLLALLGPSRVARFLLPFFGGNFMKFLIIPLAIVPLATLAMGDGGLLPRGPGPMVDTVGTLNQVTDEKDVPPAPGPQDQQEMQHQKDLELERKIEQGRYDEVEKK